MLDYWRKVVSNRRNSQKVLRKCTIALTGLVGAGKSTLVPLLQTQCSLFIRENPELLVYKSEKINYVLSSCDINNDTTRRDPTMWGNYLAEAYGLVFVVDASDIPKLDAARQALLDIIEDPKLATKPVLIFANKQDLPAALDENEIEERLDLDDSLMGCKSLVLKCCAFTSENSHVDERIGRGLRWMIQSVYEHFEQLSHKVSRDLAVQVELDKLVRDMHKRRLRKMKESKRKELLDEIKRLENLQAKSHLRDVNIDRAIQDLKIGKNMAISNFFNSAISPEDALAPISTLHRIGSSDPDTEDDRAGPAQARDRALPKSPSRRGETPNSGQSATTSKSRHLEVPSSRGRASSASSKTSQVDLLPRSRGKDASSKGARGHTREPGAIADIVLPYDGPQEDEPSVQAVSPDPGSVFVPESEQPQQGGQQALHTVPTGRQMAMIIQVQRERDMLRERLEELERAEKAQRDRESRLQNQLEQLRVLLAERSRREELADREANLERDRFQEQLKQREEELEHLKRQYTIITAEYKQRLLDPDYFRRTELDGPHIMDSFGDEYLPSSSQALEWEVAAAEAELRMLHEAKQKVKREITEFQTSFQEREGHKPDKQALVEIQPQMEQLRQIEKQELFVSDHMKKLRIRVGTVLANSKADKVMYFDQGRRRMSQSDISDTVEPLEPGLAEQENPLPGSPLPTRPASGSPPHDVDNRTSRSSGGLNGRPSASRPGSPSRPGLGHSASVGLPTSRPGTASLQTLQGDLGRIKIEKMALENQLQELKGDIRRRLVDQELRLRKESGQLLAEIKAQSEVNLAKEQKRGRELEKSIVEKERKHQRELQGKNQELNGLKKELLTYEKQIKVLQDEKALLVKDAENLRAALANEVQQGSDKLKEAEQRFHSEARMLRQAASDTGGLQHLVGEVQGQLDVKASALEQASAVIDTLKAKVEELGAELLKTHNELAELQELHSRSGKEKLGLDSELERAQTACAEAQQKLKQMEVLYREEMNLRKRFYNMVEDSKGRIRVFCRARPMHDKERARGERKVLLFRDDFSVELTTSKGSKTFQFDGCFDDSTSQAAIFQDIQSLAQSAIDGYNVCILAYGQTGSGKTHTIAGSDSDPGLLTHAAREVFAIGRRDSGKLRLAVQCYMVELYMDELTDLLSEEEGQDVPPLEILKDPQRGVVFIKNVTLLPVSSESDLVAAVRRGLARRHVAATKANVDSSRSHLLFGINMETYNVSNGCTAIGKMSFVDLAGSETLNQLDSHTSHSQESHAINRSLTALADVISALSNGDSFVPYRSSKLTVLLSDSLGGNAKTVMFVNVSPTESTADETANSLAFAQRAKSVINNPVRELESKRVQRLESMIRRLKTKLGPEDESLSL